MDTAGEIAEDDTMTSLVTLMYHVGTSVAEREAVDCCTARLMAQAPLITRIQFPVDIAFFALRAN